MRKVRTSSVKSPSTVFSFSVCTMYNKVNHDQKQRLMLKSYLPGINSSSFPKRHYNSIFSENLVNELHAWIEIHPHVIHFPNLKDLLFVKINGNLVKKEAFTSNISTRDAQLYDSTNFPGRFFGSRTFDGKLCIGNTSLSKYIPIYITNDKQK